MNLIIVISFKHSGCVLIPVSFVYVFVLCLPDWYFKGTATHFLILQSSLSWNSSRSLKNSVLFREHFDLSSFNKCGGIINRFMDGER